MANRLPAHILTELLVRIDQNESPTQIERELKVARSTTYRIKDNLELWGAPYPAEPTTKLGRPALLTEAMVQVRDSPYNSIVVTLTARYIESPSLPRRPAYCVPRRDATVSVRCVGGRNRYFYDLRVSCQEDQVEP